MKKPKKTQIKRPHPMELIEVPELKVPAHEYFQICARGLLDKNFMSKIQHEKFLKKLKVWLTQNKVTFKAKEKE